MTEKERSEKGEQPPDAEAWSRQVHVARVFDQLIYNSDRSQGNLLIDRDWRLWMVDHRRAFDAFKELRNEKELPDACPRGVSQERMTIPPENSNWFEYWESPTT